MNPTPIEHPNQPLIRRRLRVIGVSMIVLGGVLMIIGMASFFMAFGTFEPPKYFWCAFIGVPMLGIGGMLAMFGYAGAMSRYMAGEAAPVAKDVANYLGEATKPGVKATSAAIAEGLFEGRDAHAAKKHPTDGSSL